MTARERLTSAVSGLARTPPHPRVYTGPDDHYFVYDITDNRGDDWGDDEPGCVHYWIELRYYFPMGENQSFMENKVRKLLMEAGFSYANIDPTSDPENGMDGIIWRCDIVAESEEQNG